MYTMNREILLLVGGIPLFTLKQAYNDNGNVTSRRYQLKHLNKPIYRIFKKNLIYYDYYHLSETYY